MIIRWLDEALNDLQDVRFYVSQNNPAAAYRLVKKILIGVERLAEQPEIGRLGRVAGTREVIISNLP